MTVTGDVLIDLDQNHNPVWLSGMSLTTSIPPGGLTCIQTGPCRNGSSFPPSTSTILLNAFRSFVSITSAARHSIWHGDAIFLRQRHHSINIPVAQYSHCPLIAPQILFPVLYRQTASPERQTQGHKRTNCDPKSGTRLEANTQNLCQKRGALFILFLVFLDIVPIVLVL